MGDQLCGLDTSAVVLIGCHAYEELKPLPAVENNLTALAERLADPDIWGVREDLITVLQQPPRDVEVLRAVRDAGKKATDALIVYYAGHGLLDPMSQELHLSLPDSRLTELYVESAMRFDLLRRVLLSSKAEKKVLLLDCCFSGRAMAGEMSGDAGLVPPPLEVAGTCVITACSENARALAPADEPYTAFTGELLQALDHGVPGAGEFLNMTDLYDHILGELRAKSLPLPQQRSRNTAARICLARNHAAPAQLASTDSYIPSPGNASLRGAPRTEVTVIGHPLTVGALQATTEQIEQLGGQVDQVRSLATSPVTAVVLAVTGVHQEVLRPQLASQAAKHQLDLLVTVPGLHQRARKLVALNTESTLIQGNIIELFGGHLPERRGRKISEMTTAAMRGELEFEQALRDSVALLEGLPESVVHTVQAEVRLTPGARTFIRTMRRLGSVVGVISDGFTQVTDDLVHRLNINFGAANTLEIVHGKLTGRIMGDVLTGPNKAQALRRFAAEEGIPLSQTIAVSASVNDLDLLRAAGLSLGFNPPPAVRNVVDTTLNTPFLDTVLYFVGISRQDIEEADNNI